METGAGEVQTGTKFWNVHRVEELRRLKEAGRSAGQIAIRWKFVISRSAIIGKCYRLGIPSSGRAAVTPEQRLERERRRDAYRAKWMRERRARRAEAKKNLPIWASGPPPAPEKWVDEIPIEQRKTLVQLTSRTCHYPIGDPKSPDFYFCGGEAAVGVPYCAVHARRCYQPPKAKGAK